MSDIPSSNTKIQLEGAQFRSSVSENLIQTMGAAINYSLDQLPLKQNISTLNRLKFMSSVTGSGTVTSTSSTTIFTATYYTIVHVTVTKTGGNGGCRVFLGASTIYDGTLDVPAGFVPHGFTLFLTAGQTIGIANGSYWNMLGLTEGNVLGYYAGLSIPDGVSWTLNGIQFNNVTG